MENFLNMRKESCFIVSLGAAPVCDNAEKNL